MNSVKFELKPIEEVPKGKRRYGSKYDPILDQFLECGHEIVHVKIEGIRLSNVSTMLNKRIELRDLKESVEVGLRGGVLYLRKL